jgi:hypothetical protein
MNKSRFMKKSLLLLAIMSIMMFAMSITAFAEDAPTGLKQTGDSTTSVTISWDAVLGQNLCYNIYYSTKPDSGFVLAKEHISGTSATINGLTAGKTYYVAVKTVAKSGSIFNYSYSEVSDLSQSLEVVTSPSSDGATLEQVGATTNSITVKLSKVDGADQYILKVEGNEVVSKSATITSKKNLTSATGYTAYVYPCRVSSTGYVAGASSTSKSLKCKTLAKKINKSSFYCSGKWTYLNEYDFEAKISGGGSVSGTQWQFFTMKGKKALDKTTTEHSVKVSNVLGTFYKYRVRTYINTESGKIYSKWSDYKYIGNPKNVTINKSGKKLKVSWSKASGATSYTVYVSTKSDTGYKKVGTVSAKKRSIVISKYKNKSLKKGTKYYVRVVSNVKVGKKTYSTEVVFNNATTL